MAWTRDYRWKSKEEHAGKPRLLLRSAREPIQPVRVDGREIKSCFCAVVEDDGMEDFPGASRETERETQLIEYSFDVRDLLVDELD